MGTHEKTLSSRFPVLLFSSQMFFFFPLRFILSFYFYRYLDHRVLSCYFVSFAICIINVSFPPLVLVLRFTSLFAVVVVVVRWNIMACRAYIVTHSCFIFMSRFLIMLWQDSCMIGSEIFFCYR